MVRFPLPCPSISTHCRDTRTHALVSPQAIPLARFISGPPEKQTSARTDQPSDPGPQTPTGRCRCPELVTLPHTRAKSSAGVGPAEVTSHSRSQGCLPGEAPTLPSLRAQYFPQAPPQQTWLRSLKRRELGHTT